MHHYTYAVGAFFSRFAAKKQHMCAPKIAFVMWNKSDLGFSTDRVATKNKVIFLLLVFCSHAALQWCGFQAKLSCSIWVL